MLRFRSPTLLRVAATERALFILIAKLQWVNQLQAVILRALSPPSGCSAPPYRAGLGTTIDQKIRAVDAPSTRAASIS